jgi:hypothetical protein
MQNNDNRFDLDLDFGQTIESRLQKILASKGKIEIKTERDVWKRTGNFVIETECRGKPSGLMTTQADWWIHAFYNSDQDEIEFAFLFQVEKLKKYIDSKEHLVSYGGDDNLSKLVIIPIQDVHEILRNNKL